MPREVSVTTQKVEEVKIHLMLSGYAKKNTFSVIEKAIDCKKL